MYPVLRLGTSTLFILAPLLFWGCGAAVSGPQVVKLPVQERSLSDAAECRSTEKIASSPYVYRCDTNLDTELGALFISTLKDCSVSDKFSFQATTRQLFVGITGLTVISQASLSFGNKKALHSLITGTLDAQPLTVSTFTFREEGCVTDLVIWRSEESTEDMNLIRSRFSKLSQKLAEHLISTDSVAIAAEPAHAKS